MSRLSDLYKAMETLRKEGLSLNEDLEKQVSDLEENIIKKEILPIVTETIAPALKQVQRELVLVVDYVPGIPISVHLSRLKITFANGNVIQESQASETFRKFVMEIGAERVRSLGLKQNKVPLISNTLDKKYKSSQKAVGNGWYLMTCSNTLTKKRDIERIANAFKVKVKVEII